MITLKKRWILFFDVLIDPWNLLLIIAVAVFYYLSVNQTSSLASTLLFILITLASVMLGGRITKQWADLTEGSIVIARGRSAVRSLKVLLRLVTALEERIHDFRIREDEIEKHPEVTKRNYEEAISSCKHLQEQTVNSIENWTDILPEADIKTDIGVISDLKNTLKDKENELAQLNLQLNEVAGKSVDERSKLKKEIIANQLLINKLQREIQDMDRKVGLGGLGLSDLAMYTPVLYPKSTLADLFNKTNSGVLSGSGNVTDVSHGTNLPLGAPQSGGAQKDKNNK